MTGSRRVVPLVVGALAAVGASACSGQSAVANRPHATEQTATLTGQGIGSARFGQPAPRVMAYLTRLAGRPAQGLHASSACGLDHIARWRSLTAYFQGGRFVGYSYRGTDQATQAGLRVGDQIVQARRLYGAGLKYSAINGGRWWLDPPTPSAAFTGYLIGPSGVPNHLVGPKSRIENVSAGAVGCPSSPGL